MIQRARDMKMHETWSCNISVTGANCRFYIEMSNQICFSGARSLNQNPSIECGSCFPTKSRIYHLLVPFFLYLLLNGTI